MIARKHPDWIRVRAPVRTAVTDARAIVKSLRLHTVCEEAQCPNLGECSALHTATFMLLGDTCTRNCHFCAVNTRPTRHGGRRRAAAGGGGGGPPRAQACRGDLRNRDDLADGGAGHFAETARQVRAHVPDCTVEVLVLDFQGDGEALAMVVRHPLRVPARTRKQCRVSTSGPDRERATNARWRYSPPPSASDRRSKPKPD